MAYYLRAFCTSPTVPTLAEVLDWVRERGVSLSVDPEDMTAGATTRNWDEGPVCFIYAENQPPFIVELNKKEGDDSLAAQESNEFLGMLQDMKKSRKRDRVIEQLQQTQYIIACQIPTDTNFGDAGFHAVDVFLAYFVVHSGGMVQADGQGFYEMGKLIVEVE